MKTWAGENWAGRVAAGRVAAGKIGSGKIGSGKPLALLAIALVGACTAPESRHTPEEASESTQARALEEQQVPTQPLIGHPVRIVAPQDVVDAAGDLIARYPAMELVGYTAHREMVAAMPGAHAVIGWTVTEKAVRASDELRWVHVLTGGVNEYVAIPEIRDNEDLVLTSMKIQKGPEVADHAMALLLGLTRNLRQSMLRMETGMWDGSSDLPVIELRGKTMLIIGMGGIGTQLAERAHASGMRVIGTDPKDIPFMGAVDYVGHPDELAQLLPEADVVAVCAPYTPESKQILDEAAFAQMKDGTYLIVVSRGELVDTDAMVDALNSGKLVAAGLDALDPEPLPRNHPLWSMPNVIITPHFAGRSDGRVVRQRALTLTNIERFMQGLPLKNQIDKVRGY